MDTSSTTQINGSILGTVSNTQSFFLRETCTDTYLRDSCGKDSSKKFCWTRRRKSTELGMNFFTGNTDDSERYTWLTSRWMERSRRLHPCGRNRRTLILMNRHQFLTTHTWDALNVNANRTRSLLSNRKRCLNHVFLLEQMKNCQDGKSHMRKLQRGPTTTRSRHRWRTGPSVAVRDRGH